METTSVTEPTPDQIESWKREHKIANIHVLKARDKRDGQIKKAFMRTPKFSDLTIAAQSDKKKAGTYNQSLYENCVLWAHPDIAKDDALYQGIVFAMGEIVITADVEVEKI